jgi:hypothetical protein
LTESFRLRLSWGTNSQPEPSRQKTKAADRSDGAQPLYVGKGKQIQAAAKEYNSRDKQAHGNSIGDRQEGEEKQSKSMDEMIKHSGFPNLRGLVCGES